MAKIIGASYGFGASAYGAEKSPIILKNTIEQDYKDSCDFIMVEGVYSPDRNSFRDRIKSCVDFASNLYNEVKKHQFPLIVGGDHSIAIGTWSGVKANLNSQKDNFRLGMIWIDAHMDSHIPETSPSNSPHGLPLASLMGLGDRSMCSIGDICPKLLPEDVVLIGIRSYEEEEYKILQDLGVRIIFIDEFLKNEEAAIKEALEIVTKNTDGYGVSLDFDVIDPELFCATGCLEPNGFSLEQLWKVIKGTISEKLKAVEIVEFSPDRDIESKSLKIAADVVKYYNDVLNKQL